VTHDRDVVARKEFRDALRSKGLWVPSLVFTAFFVIPAAAALWFDVGIRGGQDVGMQLLIRVIYPNIVTLFLPLVAIFAGYAAISKERTSGSLKLLLSLPHPRKDVIIGKVVGRCGVVGVLFAGAFIVNALFLIASRLTFKPGLYVTFALFSPGVRARDGGRGGQHLRRRREQPLLHHREHDLLRLDHLLLEPLGELHRRRPVGLPRHHGRGELDYRPLPEAAEPSQAYKTIMNSMLGDGGNAERSARFSMFSGANGSEQATICNDVSPARRTRPRPSSGTQTSCLETAQSVLLYFSDGAALFYLLLWIGLAAAVSYYTFNQYDP